MLNTLAGCRMDKSDVVYLDTNKLRVRNSAAKARGGVNERKTNSDKQSRRKTIFITLFWKFICRLIRRRNANYRPKSCFWFVQAAGFVEPCSISRVAFLFKIIKIWWKDFSLQIFSLSKANAWTLSSSDVFNINLWHIGVEVRHI